MNDVLPRIDIGIDNVYVKSSHFGDLIPLGTIPVYQADNLVCKVIAVRKEGSCRGCCFDGLGFCHDIPCGSIGFIFKKVDDMLEDL